MKSLLSIILLMFALACHASNDGWTGTWATAIEPVGKKDMPKCGNLANRSVRQIIKVSAGGKEIRLKLSNRFSGSPLEIKSVFIADAADSSSIRPKTARWITFGHKKNIVIKAGEGVVSDPLRYDLRPLQRLAITINYGNTPEAQTGHRGSRNTSYIIKGKGKPSTSYAKGERIERWFNIDALEVKGSAKRGIAILGNSITDGYGSSVNKNDRWADIMAEKLEGNDLTDSTGVMNLGIGGNCVLRGGLGPTALKRFDYDILGQSGVTDLIIFEAINDIGWIDKNAQQCADELIEAYKQFIDKAHAKGMKVYGATITPFGKSFYYKGFFREAARQTVNEWIRTSGAFDGVIDFDSAMRDPEAPNCMKEAYQKDWLHPNPDGYKAMGEFAAEYFIEQAKAK